MNTSGQLAAYANTTVNPNNALVTATGSTTPITLANRFAQIVNVLNFGADPTGITDSTSAITAACSSLALNSTLYFPTGTYKYSNGLSLLQGGTIQGDDAVLNYIGNGYAVTLGPSGLTAPDFGLYVVDGLTFIGGASMTHGIYINPYVVFPKITNNYFKDFGSNSTTAFAVFAQYNNWHVFVSSNSYINTRYVTTNFLRTNGYSTTGSSDGGNTHLICTGNTVSSIAGVGGIGIWNMGVGDIITNNKIEGFSPNIRIGSTGNATEVAENYFECTPASGNNNCIEFGDPSGGYNTTAYVLGIKIHNNYCNLHQTDYNNSGNFIAPSTGNVTTGLQYGSNVSHNRFASTNSSIPTVKLNNISSQINNLGWDNMDIGTGVVSPLISSGQYISAWKGDQGNAITLASNAATQSSPQAATARLTIDGYVQLSGILTSSGTTITTGNDLAYLISSYVPNRNVLVPVAIGGTGGVVTWLNISNAGTIACGTNITTSTLLYLDSVRYKLNN